ncbi:MAG: HD domain-containing protein [Mucilaginibacter sp.]
MQFKRACNFILSKLQKELPAHLLYHSINHTTDVYRAAERIAKGEGITNDERKLLLTAASFHDSGFLKAREGHETESCNLARRYLPGYNYNAVEIELICGMIMATKLPQSPHTLLEEILCDADLDYLGRDDFFLLSNILFSELHTECLIKGEREWNMEQAEFMGNHHYFTHTSVKTRQANKEHYIKLVKSKI